MSSILHIEKMWDILDKYTFDIDMNLYSHVKCAICQNLLNNAYECMCGCSYCKKCIDGYLKTGNKSCPGVGEECQSKEMCSLDNLVKSNSADRNVSKLPMKCPSNSCNHNCCLIDMHEHLGVCDNIDIFCPYGEIGCPAEPMRKEVMGNHLMAELPLHNKLLIDWIINMKNEITSFIIKREKEEIPNQLIKVQESISLKLSEVMNRNSEEIDRQTVLIEHLQAELKNEKNKNFELQNEIDKKYEKKEKDLESLKESVRDQLEQMRIELRNIENKNQKSPSKLIPSKSKQEIDFLKPVQTTEQGIDNIETSILSQIEKSYKNKECKKKESVKNSHDYMKANLVIYPNSGLPNECATVQVSSEPLKNIASFVWDIFETDRVKKKSVVVNSDYFYSNHKQHKMWLDLYFSGHRNKSDSGVRIRYYIGVGPYADQTTWPFEGVVSLTIKDKFNEEASICASKSCLFDKPKMNWSFETFMFLYPSLDQSSVLRHNSISIECNVGF